MVFSVRRETEPELDAVFQRVRTTAMEAGAALLVPDAERAGIAVDSVRGQVLAEALYGTLTSVIAWWLRHPEVPREQIVDILADQFWDGLPH